MSLKNIQPTMPSQLRLAVIGECPTKDDVLKGEAYSSGKGHMVKGVLASIGAAPQACLLANIRQVPAPYGNLSRVEMDDKYLNLGLRQLQHDLNVFQPNCCLLMGPTAMKLFGQTDHSLEVYRGSIFWSEAFRVKCVATYDILRGFQSGTDMALIKFDMRRAYEESATKTLSLPQRKITIASDFATAINFLNEVAVTAKLVGFDVEGYPDGEGITCFSFAMNSGESTVIPIRTRDHKNVWTVQEECMIWQKTAEILENPEIAKIAQNGMYELFIFAWKHRIVVANLQDDTMLRHWELFCEMDKNLGIQTSLYTREPYFKDGRKDKTDEGHWHYNAMDSCILLDINDKQREQLRDPTSQEAYAFRMQLLKPYTYLTMAGCKIDYHALSEHRTRLMKSVLEKQQQLNDLIGRPFNVKSSKDRPWLIYEKYGFKKRYKTVDGFKRLTADEEAYLECAFDSTDEQREVLDLVLSLTKDRTDLSDTYKLEPFDDGNIRCGYNPVGTDTGRLSSSATPVREAAVVPKLKFDKLGNPFFKPTNVSKEKNKKGTNLQNVSKWLRNVFVPDSKDKEFWQYDFSGADAWTVAADLAALGNDRMLHHLTVGIKPSCVILMMHYYGVEVLGWTDEQILAKQPEMKENEKMYVCSKACQHGSNYGMKEYLLAATIFKRSKGTIRIEPAIAGKLQNAYENYYQVSRRTKWVEQTLQRQGYLVAAGGTKRRFFNVSKGRPIDIFTLRSALSFEPQYNTTYATNMALYRLYYDSRNRLTDSTFKADPRIMIHDALAGQSLKSQRDEVTSILEWAFSVDMTIHGVPITIPAEGGFGPNWKEC